VHLTENGPALAGTIPLRDVKAALDDFEEELRKLDTL
jgi:hypothetical protein